MGKIKQGILGGFRGKVGTVIGASWNGISYMRDATRLLQRAPGPRWPVLQRTAGVPLPVNAQGHDTPQHAPSAVR